MLLKRQIFTGLSKSVKLRSVSLKPTIQFSTKSYIPKTANLLYGGLALFFGVSGVTYASMANKTEPLRSPMDFKLDSYISKEDAKKLLPQAKELDEKGRNREAVMLYRHIYRAYNRAKKASKKKQIFLAHRLGILKALEGNNEMALMYLTESFERSSDVDPTSDSHFEQYFDLSLIHYRSEEYSSSNEMFKTCLEMAKYAYEDKFEVLASIHQFLGFGYHKKGEVQKAEKHLTSSLKYFNMVKKDNKRFMYYSCKQFMEFYLTTGDTRKALLFLEQARVLLNQDLFSSDEMKEKSMNVLSPITRKYLQDLNIDYENEKLQEISDILYMEMGPYIAEAQRRNLPYHKLSKEEKDFSIHGLLKW